MRNRCILAALLVSLTMMSWGCASAPEEDEEFKTRVSALSAPDAGYTFLGKRKVNFKAERDVIKVTAKEGRFKSIRLKAAGRAIAMFDIVVTFGNGNTWSPNTRLVFEKGSWSRDIDLPGEARVIRKVEFVYKSLAAKKKKKRRRNRAAVLLFGR